MLKYLMEVVYLLGFMVVELGEDEMLVKWVGLLYDIGKVIDYEVEGSYVEIGVELVIKYKEYLVVINVIVFYYGDIELILIIVVLVVVVDVLFVVRLGVCSEILENYICCFEKLEEILEFYEGVEKLFVI